MRERVLQRMNDEFTSYRVYLVSGALTAEQLFELIQTDPGEIVISHLGISKTVENNGCQRDQHVDQHPHRKGKQNSQNKTSPLGLTGHARKGGLFLSQGVAGLCLFHWDIILSNAHWIAEITSVPP